MESLNETLTFSMSNISDSLNGEIDDLREIIIKEVGQQVANLTDELNALKQKQNEIIDIGQIISINFFEQYATFADSIRVHSNGSFQELTSKSLNMINYFIMNPSRYSQRIINKIHNRISLKLRPVDENLNKVS